MSDLIVLGSPADTDTCVVPGVVGPPNSIRALNDVDPEYHKLLMPWDQWFFPFNRSYQLTTTWLLNAAQCVNRVKASSSGPFHFYSHEVLREPLPPRPPEGYELMNLQMSGPRRLFLEPPQPDIPQSGGERDCTVAWLRRDGGNPRERQLIAIDGEVSLTAIKEAAGVLFLQSPHLMQPSGKRRPPRPTGDIYTWVVFMEATLFLGKPGTPDNILLHLYGHRALSGNAQSIPSLPHFWEVAEAGKAWKEAYARAVSMFRARTEAVNQPRVSLFDGVAADRLAAYQAELEAFSNEQWQEALDCVQEAWQLATACRHFRPEQFAHRTTANKRGRDMVTAYCSAHPERVEAIGAFWEEARLELQAQEQST